ncbi:MAG: hypothetical protein HQL32_04170 [Planctomycetes bacterium]|nr:hypothetical protein [Planctomycetota bacterium]
MMAKKVFLLILINGLLMVLFSGIFIAYQNMEGRWTKINDERQNAKIEHLQQSLYHFQDYVSQNEIAILSEHRDDLANESVEVIDHHLILEGVLLDYPESHDYIHQLEEILIKKKALAEFFYKEKKRMQELYASALVQLNKARDEVGLLQGQIYLQKVVDFKERQKSMDIPENKQDAARYVYEALKSSSLDSISKEIDELMVLTREFFYESNEHLLYDHRDNKIIPLLLRLSFFVEKSEREGFSLNLREYIDHYSLLIIGVNLKQLFVPDIQYSEDNVWNLKKKQLVYDEKNALLYSKVKAIGKSVKNYVQKLRGRVQNEMREINASKGDLQEQSKKNASLAFIIYLFFSTIVTGYILWRAYCILHHQYGDNATQEVAPQDITG